MKLLFENWRKYLLNEVSFADAKEILNSKGTLKIIKNYEYECTTFMVDRGPKVPRTFTNNLKIGS